MHVRPERPDDFSAVRAINRAAFESDGEADLVDALRTQASPLISMVADDDGVVVGHILFSPVTLTGHETIPIAGLAPMAVAPSRQRSGTGSALVRAGLSACREQGFAAVVVVGHPEYYPRFGFQPASQLGLTCEFEVADEAWMTLELTNGVLRGCHGTVRYHPAFQAL